jgi:hypothetical protein
MPIPDTVSAARIVQECRAGQEVIRVGERVGGAASGQPGIQLVGWPLP